MPALDKGSENDEFTKANPNDNESNCVGHKVLIVLIALKKRESPKILISQSVLIILAKFMSM